jgi:hypothetical protein
MAVESDLADEHPDGAILAAGGVGADAVGVRLVGATAVGFGTGVSWKIGLFVHAIWVWVQK